jgi:hypothetical protein
MSVEPAADLRQIRENLENCMRHLDWQGDAERNDASTDEALARLRKLQSQVHDLWDARSKAWNAELLDHFTLQLLDIRRSRVGFQSSYETINTFAPLEQAERVTRRLLSEARQRAPNTEPAQSAEPQPPSAPEAIQDFTPRQQLGPFQYEFEQGVLRIRHVPAISAEDRTEIVDQARRALIEQGARLLTWLKETNCDHRVIETIAFVQERLERKQDIVALGVANSAATMMGAELADELAPVVTTMLKSHSASIAMYLSQFPDWVTYVRSLGEVKLSPADIEQLAASGRDLLAQLGKAGDAVHSEVPASIRFLLRLVADPEDTAQSTAFALIRTIENLVARIFRYGAAFLDAPISGAIEGIRKGTSSAVSKLVIAGLLAAAVELAGGFGPIVAKLGELEWIQQVADIVRPEIQKLLTEH